MFSKFVCFKNQVENLFSTTIKCFRLNGGGEFVNKNFIELFQNSGIIHQLTCLYTPPQNGIAERKHHHLIKTIVVLLQTSSMSHLFWGEAVLTTTYLINRLPSSILQGKSSYIVLFNTSLDYHSLRVFRCACYPWLKPYTTNKLEPRSRRCVFIEYPINIKGYKCYDMITGRAFISRYVLSRNKIFRLHIIFLKLVLLHLH